MISRLHLERQGRKSKKYFSEKEIPSELCRIRIQKRRERRSFQRRNSMCKAQRNGEKSTGGISL